ncbi:AfsR/SARP family transcriptional regulator [Nocardiopsis sp. MG754419]|uniref:AfsR/SARP family transcriptional regulator n=1 Tax=Nocardiopsis sp. MG754419 TaxID=2259865 RepID=UPI001BA9EC55|nr:AfsR/SARP family transcriptional regulator [Nocardiopsis sp. MG754419]MBR8741843.1 hypothetical protein [Nocardiopsis sp. MG754419]
MLSLLRSYNQTVSVDRLLREVWGDDPPKSGSRIIPPYVYRLRKLAPCGEPDWVGLPIARKREGYVLQIDPDSLDRNRCNSLIRRSQEAKASGELELAHKLVSEALGMWGEEPLVGLVGPLAQSMRLNLVEQRLMAIERRIELDFLLGRHRDVIPELRQYVELNPLSEPMAELLMTALYECNRQAEALAVFHGLRTRLAEETGTGPGGNLQQIYEAILRSEPVPQFPVAAMSRTETGN